MTYLLDTNALIWFASGSRSLGKNARAVLRGNKVIQYSPFSLVELKIKQAKGKIATSGNFLGLLLENNFC